MNLKPICPKFGSQIGDVDVEKCNMNCSPIQIKTCFDLWVEFDKKRDLEELSMRLSPSYVDAEIVKRKRRDEALQHELEGGKASEDY